ncbi:MAG TPA: ATP-binding protein, partial [Fibrobacteria bacterium]|nr:ATP-binding protein [Fibrobacteria bacterium]
GLRRNGEEFPVELSITSLQVGDRWLFTAFLRDITALKMAEERLRKVQRVEALEQLAGGIAHDFNDLLTAINGYGALAMEGLEPGSPRFAFLSEILKAGERAATLTRQLLMFSRKREVDERIWNLNDILTGMEPVIRVLTGEHIQLRLRKDPGLGGIRVDRVQVEQIIMNLLLNARDAMPNGGILTLETARRNGPFGDTVLKSMKEGPHTVLTVGDTGPGMPPEVLSRIFEPFFTTKEPGSAAGLGLSVVLGLVEKSSGDLSVRSEPGKGAVFEIYFLEVAGPDETPAAPPEKARQPTDRGHEVLLLVEDEDQVRRFAAKVLESLGYSVLQASNGKEALERLEKDPSAIDLLISDLIMPDLGGIALAGQARRKYPGLPVLFISGYSESAVVRLEMGGVGAAFLQKPFSPHELAEKVREVLNLARGEKAHSVNR